MSGAFNPGSQITVRTRTNDSYVYRSDGVLARTYTVNGLNQYLTAGVASFTYDANVNLTSDVSLTLVYDAENRPVTATGSARCARVLVWRAARESGRAMRRFFARCLG